MNVIGCMTVRMKPSLHGSNVIGSISLFVLWLCIFFKNIRQMDFNLKKCATMRFLSSNRKQKYEHKMKGEILETVSQHPYLGVELNDNLKFNDRIYNITKISSSTLGFLKRNLKYCPPKVKERAYASLVHPKLGYVLPIWNQSQKHK